MFVRWNEKGTKIIPLTRTMRGTVMDPRTDKPVDAMVENPELSTIKTRREAIMLGPGVNEITEEEFALAKPNILSDLRTKKIQEVRLPVSARKAKEGEHAQKISDLSVDTAIRLVHACGRSPDGQRFVPNYGNRDTLYRWLAEETRENVTVEIFTRLRDLGFLSAQEARDKKPDPRDLAAARALVADEASSAVTEEDYVVDESDYVLTEV